MCGIFAAYSSDKNTDIRVYTITADSIAHRGPDETKHAFVRPHVFFGFHRLAINGLDSLSGQPLENKDCVIVCNGEIYNYKELAQKYDITLETDSDCEILVHLYSKLGISFLKELDAEFALVLYDKNKEVMYAARDHIGVRPLFVGNVDLYTTLFSSEARALTRYCKNIRQFLPGSVSSSEHCLSQESLYYDYLLCVNKYFRTHSLEEVYSHVHDILVKSTRDRLISDRPVGAFLSGGLDSSVIVSILSKYVPDLHVFTVGLKGSPDIDAAKKVASFLNLEKNHHILEYTVEEGIAALPKVICSLESYDITTVRASTPQWLLSEYIKENTDIRVLFSGECIDEVCGYFFLSFCKNNDEFINYTQSMLKELHLFDLLRTDRTTSAHGLEVRVPFASKDFLNYVMNINPSFKRFEKGCIEKKIIRKAFSGYLPKEILNRKKHAFSDSVSNKAVSWYKQVSLYAEKNIDEKRWEKRSELYPHNTPVSKESFLYREMFEKEFKNYGKLIPHFWMPKGVEENVDPSATVLEGFVTE